MDNYKYGKIKAFFAHQKAVVLLFLLLSSCSNKKHPKKQDLPEVSFEFIRFERLFYDASDISLQELKTDYPYLFPLETPDSIWHAKRKDSLQIVLYEATQTIDTPVLKERIATVLQRTKFYFPKTPMPKKVISLLTDVDYTLRAVDADSLFLLSIDTYLGAAHDLYQGIPLYIKRKLSPAHLESEIIDALAPRFVPNPKDRSFLAQMIMHGKRLLLHDYLAPHLSAEKHIQYTAAQWTWAEDHEAEVWDYFLANELLFSTDDRLHFRFLTPGPFSKFYSFLDQDSPGRIGQWVGYRIVRAYQKRTDATLTEVLQADAQEILKKSRYNP
jgi:hypothetical protein